MGKDGGGSASLSEEGGVVDMVDLWIDVVVDEG
jgi:hypothetical protein